MIPPWRPLEQMTPDDLVDLGTVGVAVLALLVSLVVAFYTVRSQRKMARTATYERLHEQLVSPATAAGRRELFLRGPSSHFPQPATTLPSRNEEISSREADLWDIMNQALAWYDTLGTYYEQRGVPRRKVLRAWFHPLIAIRPHAYRFLDHRSRQGIEQPWGSLQALLEAALWYKCRCRSCRLNGPVEPQHQPGYYKCGCASCRAVVRDFHMPETKPPLWVKSSVNVGCKRRWPGLQEGD